jgi:hypothetical protein
MVAKHKQPGLAHFNHLVDGLLGFEADIFGNLDLG